MATCTTREAWECISIPRVDQRKGTYWCMVSFNFLHLSFIGTKASVVQPWEELLPRERTQWHWSKRFKFSPSWIMTFPPRLSFSAQLTNCNLATSWHIEISILGLLHFWISSASMKFFQLKITLGLALGESWLLLAQMSIFALFRRKAFPSLYIVLASHDRRNNSWPTK